MLRPCWQGVAVATVGLWLGAVTQLAILVAFAAACRRSRMWPEPLFNPPTVNCAVTSIVGASLGAGRGPVAALTFASFALAVALAAFLFPIEAYRVLADDSISASAVVAMLQAPWSLNSLTWGVMQRSRLAPILGDYIDRAIAHTCFAASTCGLGLTLLALWRRRRPIWSKGFGLDWAAFTFPSCSSAVAALQYAASPPSRIARSLLDYYALVLAIVVLGVVFAILAGNALLALRHWLRENKGKLDGSPKRLTDDADLVPPVQDCEDHVGDDADPVPPAHDREDHVGEEAGDDCGRSA